MIYLSLRSWAINCQSAHLPVAVIYATTPLSVSIPDGHAHTSGCQRKKNQSRAQDGEGHIGLWISSIYSLGAFCTAV